MEAVKRELTELEKELLEVLENIANEMQSASSSGRGVGPDWFDRRIRVAREAIAKASGQRPERS
jgi:hypothetical protein